MESHPLVSSFVEGWRLPGWVPKPVVACSRVLDFQAYVYRTHFAACAFPGASYSKDMPIAVRTSSMVALENLRALAEPASRISQASRGFSSYFLRRSCIGFRML